MFSSLKKDKIIKFTSILIVIILISFTAFFLIPSGLKMQHNNTIILNRCGITKSDYIEIPGDHVFASRLFLFPYNLVKININDYFSLKEGKRPEFFTDNRNTIEGNNQVYYTKIIFAGKQSVYYSEILKELQKIKTIYNLDDDEYLQLIVNFVQSMPYFTDNSSVKYPLATFVDGCGDCDDKSLLLLALLSQEDYNVSIFIIPAEGSIRYNHAMAGVASKSVPFTKKGYAMIETTQTDSAIGEFPSYALSENVFAVRIGNGTKTYETYYSVLVNSNNSMLRELIKGGKTVSITEYHQDFNIFDFFTKPNSLG
jgi:hypothetical protein